MLALITPVMTFDRRALGGDDQVDADGAGHLGDAADRLLDVAGRHHHQVVQLVDHDQDERQPLVLATGSSPEPSSGRQLAPVEGGVVAGDVADADLGAAGRSGAPSRSTAQASALAAFLGLVTTWVSRCGRPLYWPSSTRLGSTRIMPHLVGRGAHRAST